MKDEEIRVGEIIKPHGVEGAFLVDVLTDFPGERFAVGNVVRVVTDAGREQFTVESGSEHQGRWLMEFHEVNDRDEAEDLRGSDIVISEEEVIGREGELYDFDLIGMNVFNQEGEPMGTIVDVGMGRNLPTLRIQNEDHGTIEFPADENLIIDSNRHEGWIKLKFQSGWKNLIQD